MGQLEEESMKSLEIRRAELEARKAHLEERDPDRR